MDQCNDNHVLQLLLTSRAWGSFYITLFNFVVSHRFWKYFVAMSIPPGGPAGVPSLFPFIM